MWLLFCVRLDRNDFIFWSFNAAACLVPFCLFSNFHKTQAEHILKSCYHMEIMSFCCFDGLHFKNVKTYPEDFSFVRPCFIMSNFKPGVKSPISVKLL